MAGKDKLGPTGDFPQGKIAPHDEGGIQVGVTFWRGTVRIDFGGPVAWLAMPPEEAINFAKLILRNAGVKNIEITL